MTKTDKDHREAASYVMKAAHIVVTTERGNQHGGAEDSFQMIADMWGVYLRNTIAQSGADVSHVKVTPKDVAQMMVLLKIARHTHGDPSNADNFIDAIGYTGLAAALAGIQAPRPVQAGSSIPPQPAPTKAQGVVNTTNEPTVAEVAAKYAPRSEPIPVTKSEVKEGGGQLAEADVLRNAVSGLEQELSR